ncbi:hypothetical protein [Motiliproteus sp. MSK22-1]|uniref:hypothetical protein n=1 Tax=Motiliproteus sp. MSK22-1 TaxID=1897630 RepID=UPI0009762EF4|nr:hypothetical protein [Motiliproteus sp. MSK22-1]OMH25753.1 hypothetical protein BGP75_24815 [Motiliproteus sp. MSK22-1]
MTRDSSDPIIVDLLSRWDDNKYDIPLGIIDDMPSDLDPYNGFEAGLFLYWSSQNRFLNEKVQKLVEIYLPNMVPLSHKKLVEFMKNTVGYDLTASFYNEKSKDFAVDYLSFSRHWKYHYYEDLDILYPAAKKFSDIPQTENHYKNILELLDNRYKEWKTS